jgi:hypothetical protein
MRRALTTLAAATALLGVMAPSVSADPDCPPTLRAYPSLDNGPGDPEDPNAFGKRMAFFARGDGEMFGQQVSNEADTRVPCPEAFPPPRGP